MMSRMAADSPVAKMKPLAYSQFLIAASLISVIVLGFYVFALNTKKDKTYLVISTVIAAGLLLNALIPHIVVAIYKLSNAPGVVTAILLIVPISLWLLFKNMPLFESRRQMVYQILAGLLIAYGLFALTVLAVKFLF